MISRVLEWAKVHGCKGLKVLGFKGAKCNKGAEVKKVNSGIGCSQELISD